MRVTTKKGDRGWTDLLFGGRVRKDHPRVEAVGTLDELTSFLGLAKCTTRRAWVRDILHAVQQDLFILNSEVMTLPRHLRRLRFRVTAERVKRLEGWLADCEKKMDLRGCCFLIPGGNAASALLDVCRSIARRSERQVVLLHCRREIPNPLILQYLNRLSDLLFLLARVEERKHVKFVARKA
jgi:cob(I)alamin adenosyltransferase